MFSTSLIIKSLHTIFTFLFHSIILHGDLGSVSRMISEPVLDMFAKVFMLSCIPFRKLISKVYPPFRLGKTKRRFIPSDCKINYHLSYHVSSRICILLEHLLFYFDAIIFHFIPFKWHNRDVSLLSLLLEDSHSIISTREPWHLWALFSLLFGPLGLGLLSLVGLLISRSH